MTHTKEGVLLLVICLLSARLSRSVEQQPFENNLIDAMPVLFLVTLSFTHGGTLVTVWQACLC